MLFRSILILFITYFSAIEGYSGRKGNPDYNAQKHLQGWTKLHVEPADWKTAAANCEQEGAVLATSWLNELNVTLSKIVSDSKKSINALYMGSQMMFPGGVYEPNKGVMTSDLKNNTYCSVYFPNNGTTGRVDCAQQYPYVCFALAPEIDCDVHEFGQNRDGYPGYNRCSKVKGWLKIHVGPADFSTANATCIKEGGSLVNPFNSELRKIALNLVQLYNAAKTPLSSVYTGGQEVHPHGAFEEVNGKLQWVTKMKTYCITLLSNNATGITECNTTLPFMCYAPYSPLAEYECDDEELEYELDPLGGRCYKLYNVGKTWEDAQDRCQQEGGDLAIINSLDEAVFLKELYAKYKSIYYSHHGWEVFVGIKEEGTGNWRTINGLSLEQDGYAVWRKDKPGDQLSDDPRYKGFRQVCGAMDREGHYSNCWCQMLHGYIYAVLVASWTDKLGDILVEIVKESNKTINKLHVGSRAESFRDKTEYCQVFDVNKVAVRAYGDCNEKIPYVCFAPAPYVDCDTVEFGQDRVGWPGYNRCSKVKGWLKIHVGPANYDTARAKCKAEDAQLVNPYIPEFKENAMKLFHANSTDEEPILAVYSLAKVIHPHGVFEKYDGKLNWVAKNKQYCVIFLPSGNLGRTECEAKLSFICYARNPGAADLFGPQLAVPNIIEMPYINPNDLKSSI